MGGLAKVSGLRATGKESLQGRARLGGEKSHEASEEKNRRNRARAVEDAGFGGKGLSRRKSEKRKRWDLLMSNELQARGRSNKGESPGGKLDYWKKNQNRGGNNADG